MKPSESGINRDNKVRYSLASYRQPDGTNVCDTVELVEIFRKNIGNVPERINFTKACEIHLLAKNFLHLHQQLKEASDE